MPPKVRFGRDDIVSAAFHVFDRSGFSGMSTLRIAEKLNSSVQPIYSHFENIETLKQVVAGKARDLFRKYVTDAYIGIPYLDPWIGEIIFAKKHKNLYFALFIERNEFEDLFYEVNLETLDIIRNDENVQGLSHDMMHSFYRHMQVYIYGLAIMVCNGYWRNEEDAGLVRVIREMGEVIIQSCKNGEILERGKWFSDSPTDEKQ